MTISDSSCRCQPGSRNIPFLLAAVIGMLCVALPCWAHKVNVFAYVEGDKIVVDGYFSKSNKAMSKSSSGIVLRNLEMILVKCRRFVVDSNCSYTATNFA